MTIQDQTSRRMRVTVTIEELDASHASNDSGSSVLLDEVKTSVRGQVVNFVGEWFQWLFSLLLRLVTGRW